MKQVTADYITHLQDVLTECLSFLEKQSETNEIKILKEKILEVFAE